jgi:hypothetical protein
MLILNNNNNTNKKTYLKICVYMCRQKRECEREITSYDNNDDDDDNVDDHLFTLKIEVSI